MKPLVGIVSQGEIAPPMPLAPHRTCHRRRTEPDFVPVGCSLDGVVRTVRPAVRTFGQEARSHHEWERYAYGPVRRIRALFATSPAARDALGGRCLKDQRGISSPFFHDLA